MESAMSYFVSDLYSVRHSPNINWYMYTLVDASTREGENWIDSNAREIGAKLGKNSAIVHGYNEELFSQIVNFLEKYLVKDVFLELFGMIDGDLNHNINIIITNKPLPHTQNMFVFTLGSVSEKKRYWTSA
jgi:hypothetical protein